MDLNGNTINLSEGTCNKALPPGLTESCLTAIRTALKPCCKEIGSISLGIVPTQLSVTAGYRQNHLPAVCSMEAVNSHLSKKGHIDLLMLQL